VLAQNKSGTRARSLIGTPVNVNIAASGTLPQGVVLTMINASFADKTRARHGGSGTPDTFGQVWLGKVRYGITDRLEIGVVQPYINNNRSGRHTGPEVIEGLGDTTLQLTYAVGNTFLGDPINLSFGAAALLPAGQYGKTHLPGNGAWGGRLVGAIGVWPTKDIRLDTEVSWSGPFERGNQHVKRGQQFQWNAFARYLWDNVDVGFESSVVHQESGDKSMECGQRNLRNGYTEWFAGPSMNVAIDSLAMWAGVGVFFPLVQDVQGPTKVEDARFEFKIGKIW
jgi:hypothetical protein